MKKVVAGIAMLVIGVIASLLTSQGIEYGFSISPAESFIFIVAVILALIGAALLLVGALEK
jgi:hypothetical protein